MPDHHPTRHQEQPRCRAIETAVACPTPSATRAARPTAERIEQAARALLTSDGWQRWIRVRASNGLSRYSLLI